MQPSPHLHRYLKGEGSSISACLWRFHDHERHLWVLWVISRGRITGEGRLLSSFQPACGIFTEGRGYLPPGKCRVRAENMQNRLQFPQMAAYCNRGIIATSFWDPHQQGCDAWRKMLSSLLHSALLPWLNTLTKKPSSAPSTALWGRPKKFWYLAALVLEYPWRTKMGLGVVAGEEEEEESFWRSKSGMAG